jgi:hypothetical protein
MHNRKCTILHGKDEAFSTLIPRELADKLLISYWKYVRPFACVIKEGLKQPFERWQRYCFVSACDEKYVRRVISTAFGGNGRTFQWVRHSANFLLKMFLKGTPTPLLPVFKLFGHSQKTDESYAVEKLSGFMPENCTNTTDVRLILEAYWSKINLSLRRENPTDSVSSEDSDESSDDEYEGLDDEAFDEEESNEGESARETNENESDAETNCSPLGKSIVKIQA